MTPRIVVAVVPARERARRRLLFDSLEQAFPVRFEGRAAAELPGADGALLIAAGAEAERAAAELGLRRLVVPAAEPDEARGGGAFDARGASPFDARGGEPDGARFEAPGGEPAGGSFELSRADRLDARLRGHRLADPAADAVAPVAPGAGDAVLATCARGPVWVTSGAGAGRRDTVALAPAELGPEECLRDRLQEGRALALLPLVCFLREVTAELAFRPPPLRAAFLLDDPNLHWPSYGHVRYGELADHADEHGYHVAMAMVPLDGWIAHPGAARLFRERADRLSVLYHGNDHVLQELSRPRDAARRRTLLAQALRRMEAFEGRTGVRVSRVMTAPHGGCSEEMARDMLQLGFEALCIGRPYPWAARPPSSWLTRPPGASPLAAFGPAIFVAGGLPVLLRRPFDYSPGDLALRAFLDQPLIVYGHHDDLEDGLAPLAHWARQVNALGRVHWGSLAEIAAGGYATRREGELLQVRLHARRASIEVPEGITRLTVELPDEDCDLSAERVHFGAAERAPSGGDRVQLGAAASSELPLDGAGGRVEVRLVRRDGLEADAIAMPAWTPWPLARRLAGQGRDRMAPLYRRVRRATAA